jgi:hypothetical protein
MKKQAPNTVDISYLSDTIKKKVTTVFDRYFAMGLVKRAAVTEELPAFPTKMSSIDGHQLADIHAHYTAFYGYTSDKLKYLKAVSTVLAKELSEQYNSALLGADFPRTAKADQIKATVKSDLAYMGVLEYVTVTTALQEMVTEERETLDKQMMSLAREIRRRESA